MVKKYKNKSSVHQPHDTLVKKLFSSPATAKDILDLYLPKEVLEIVDLNHLEPQKDSFIDDEHRAYAVDILYKTTVQGKEGYIWLLLEHQRKSQHWMPVRLFKYIAIIWDHLRKASKSKSIPLVYPVIIYNGDRPYTHSLNLSDLIEPEASKKIFAHLFTEPFCLIDLPSIEDGALRRAAQDRVKGVALLMALKHVFDKNIQAFFDQILVSLLKQLDKAGDTDEVADILYYLLNEGELDEEQFWAVFHREFSREVEGKMTTIAQKMEQRAAEKAKIEVAEQLLSDKSDLNEGDLVEWVHRMTGLSIEKIKEIQKKH